MPVTVEWEKVVFLHTPKAGGGWLGDYLRAQCRAIRRNYFLSFVGRDDSAEFRDALATQRPEGNRVVIERAFDRPEDVRELTQSPHFQQAKLLFGHATFALGALFPDYRFQYLTVLREPVQRALSNILEFTRAFDDGTTRLGDHRTRAPKYSDDYWEFIHAVLTREYPIAGLLTHESCYLRNCMTRILAGSRYRDPHETPDLYLALANAMRTQVSFFDDFNRGVQRSFDALGIPVQMPATVGHGEGTEHVSRERQRYGRHYNAPPKVVDFITEHNQIDIRLYALLKHRIDGSPLEDGGASIAPTTSPSR